MREPLSIVEFIEEHAESLAAALPQYLTRQRWFGSKSRTIRSAIPLVTLPIDNVNAVLMNVVVSYESGPSDTYQLPLALRVSDAGHEASQPLKSAVAAFDTADGIATLYDATQSAEFRAALLPMAAESEMEVADSRVTSAEQSNTSIIYGDRAILKLYRRLQLGENPDVEISRFLTQQAGFDHIPAYLGQLRGEDGSTLAFLQAFARNQGDGWEWMQAQLSASFAEATSTTNESLQAASLLGRRTAELHRALATETGDAAFTPDQFTASDLATDSTRIRNQINTALEALKANLTKVPMEMTEPVAQLLGKRRELLEFADTLATASPYRFGRRIRVHGDYHLGQVLRTTDDFLIVDFEGEPAKPLDERRRKQSPLRDVAGMLRSFSYAAASALKALPAADAASTNQIARDWELAACAAFFETYRDVMTSIPELLPQPEQVQVLLKAFLIEKALYELLYELNNRPSWLRIPLDGVLSLLREAR